MIVCIQEYKSKTCEGPFFLLYKSQESNSGPHIGGKCPCWVILLCGGHILILMGRELKAWHMVLGKALSHWG